MISVIVPVYNVERYIVNCLKSIVDQDYTDFELLLVNDGSKDNSIEYAKDYLKGTDINWRVIDKENGGLASARNAGIREAKGDYISFVDADDVWFHDFLSSLLKEIEKDDYDFSFCNFEFVKEQKAPIDDNNNVVEFTREELLKAFLKRTIGFVVPSMMFKKSFLADQGLFFDEKIRFSEDQPFIWNVILHSNRTVYLYKKMYGYYVRENSIMTSSSYDKIMNSFEEYSEYTDKLFKQYPEYADITDKALPRWELGSLYTSADLMNYEDYKKIYDAMSGKTILKRIKGIGEIKAYLLAAVSCLSPRLLYKLCRKLNLNG